MSTIVPSCILCATKLPSAALDGETLGPMFCGRHRWADAAAAGIVGFPSLPGELYAPVDELTIAARDRRFVEARRSSEPSVLLLEMDSGDLLLLFPVAHRTTFAQLVPRGAIAEEARRALPSLFEPGAVDSCASAFGTLVATHMTIVRVEYGVDGAGDLLREVLTFRFADDSLLDVEAVGGSFYLPGMANGLACSWRV